MLNKLLSFVRQQNLIVPGDRVVCAVSGGADSVALLFALYLLKEKLEIQLEAAHFNHRLRAEESDRDEAFVRELCDRYDIQLHVSSGDVKPGKKGLEAAARDARYGFFNTLSGKIATAHTADDNAETVLMHLVRGTGLKGLGGIMPVNGNVIRPMLTVTRQDVESFLEEWCVSHITDSSNDTDAFLRNRIRHHVMPRLVAENPRLAESLSSMALRLRQDEDFLSKEAEFEILPDVQTLQTMHPAKRSRMLERFLRESGVREPEQIHISQAENLLFSPKPSARVHFPGDITIARQYDRLVALTQTEALERTELQDSLELPELGLRVTCMPATQIINTPDTFTVVPQGRLYIRSRESGDAIRLAGGSKSLKKLFIDRKIPAFQRPRIPVVCDEQGILGVYTIGTNMDRIAKELPAVTIHFEKTQKERE